MGAEAFKQDPRTELIHAALTTFMEASYYEGKTDRLDRIIGLVNTVAATNPEFVAKFSIYVRQKFNMRSSFHVLTAQLSRIHRGDDLVRRLIRTGAIRVDDLVEIACYLGKPLPNQVKKGIADALTKFDPYQLAKYRAEGKKFSLVDLFNLCHPKAPANDLKLKTAWKDLIDGKLKSTGANATWESRLSSGENKKEVWKDLLSQRKLGYMACLRNLRNIAATKDEETIQMAIDFISNPKAVANSKQLPFRFLSAYKALTTASQSDSFVGLSFEKRSGSDLENSILSAVEKAITHSCMNIPDLLGETVILSDNSGSMRSDSGGKSPVSAYSQRRTSDIANLFALMYWTRAENTYVGLFGDNLIKPRLNRSKGLFENFDILNSYARKCGPGTEAGVFDAFEKLLEGRQKPDRIVIFSDCQVGKSAWYGMESGQTCESFNKLFQRFRRFSPDTMVYSIDLRGYGNTLFSDGVIELAGWSDKIFELMELAETDKQALIKEIEAIQLV